MAHLTQGARTPNEIKCFPHQPTSTGRVACDLGFRDPVPCHVFQLFVSHCCPPFSHLLTLGQADRRGHAAERQWIPPAVQRSEQFSETGRMSEIAFSALQARATCAVVL